jgi:hypothetical protein
MDAEAGFVWMHAFTHDDEFAYDAGEKHPLPYSGAHDNYDHQELD